MGFLGHPAVIPAVKCICKKKTFKKNFYTIHACRLQIKNTLHFNLHRCGILLLLVLVSLMITVAFISWN